MATILLSQTAQCQDDFFEGYNFNSGKVIIQGISLNQHQAPNISDTLGDFYVKKIASLNWIKNNWKNLETSDEYVYESTYRIDVVQNKEIQSSIFINLPKNIIQTIGTTYIFDDSLFYKQRDNYLPLLSKEYSFISVEQGRDRLDSLKSADKIISYYAQWFEYDGEFTILIPFDENFIDSEQVKSNLILKFNRLFPNHLFEINWSGNVGDNELFTVICEKKVYQMYTDQKSEWRPFSPIIYTKEIE